ncbi:MAG: diguanylate cyclase [Planctomycetes bacterium]|nr:diguanylate cyclase [Planctomycetota bacterium]
MKTDRFTVLVVDDEPHLLAILRGLLSTTYDVLTAENAAAAQTVLAACSVHVILTDQRMPGRNGADLLEWASTHFPRTIRVLMTGFSEIAGAVDAINRGQAYYYLLKPWRTEELLQVIRNALDKYRLESRQEELLAELKALNTELETRVRERTQELKEANTLLEQRTRELEHLALNDSLTGLLNRRGVEELIQNELKRHARYPNPIALGYVDVDHFKQINTRFTQAGGDEVLRTLAKILTANIREVDFVARVGGDEFLVLAPATPIEGTRVLAERIRAGVEKTCIPTPWGEVQLTVSVGFAVSQIVTDRKNLMELAAEALREAKLSGRNRFIVREWCRDEVVGV